MSRFVLTCSVRFEVVQSRRLHACIIETILQELLLRSLIWGGERSAPPVLSRSDGLHHSVGTEHFSLLRMMTTVMSSTN